MYARQSSIIPPDVFAVHNFGGSGHTPWPLVFCNLQRHQVSIKRRFMRENKEHAGNPCTSEAFSGVAILKNDIAIYMLVCYMWHVLIYLLATILVWYVYIYIHTGIGTYYLINVYWLRIMVFNPIIYTLKYGKHTVTFTFLQASRHQIQHLEFKTHSCVICICIPKFVSSYFVSLP